MDTSTRDRHEPDEPENFPFLMTVEEAAAVLRIGRSSAYAMATDFLESNGAGGLPVIRVGRRLRVPRTALLRLITPQPTAAGPAGRSAGDTQS